MHRNDRDTMFMEIAGVVSERSTCPRKSIGAVIIRENRIISIGYNGAPPGMPHCHDVGCGGGVHPDDVIEQMEPDEGEHRVYPNGCTRAIHAEVNAICFAARAGVSTRDAAMYCTCATCANCAALLVAAGVLKFVYFEEYRVKGGVKLLNEAGVEVMQWKP